MSISDACVARSPSILAALVWRSELTASTSSVSRRGKYHSVAFGLSAANVLAKRWIGVSSPSRQGRGLPDGARSPALIRISSSPFGEVPLSNANPSCASLVAGTGA